MKIHSFVDLITNSSTECFTGKTQKTREEVLMIVQHILSAYNLAHVTHYTFADVSEDFKVMDDGTLWMQGDLRGLNGSCPESLINAIKEVFGLEDSWFSG